MLEDLKEEDIVRRVGGRFKLASLVLKRQLQLLHGGRPLVEIKTTNPMEIVLEEIKQGKITLDVKSEVKEVINPPPFEATIRKAIPRGEHVLPGED
ncbi:MAG: DNA-directed RNA polymerase subunit omega [Gemmatales bacterium]|nr:DNA-directed RNA polymerase subunit omega [Gemmatales bacterium]MDW7993466.1 DNA-directed RNA polymerase subunit omega [Gemmatales bacterium]